jgi:hypothetical protein
VLQNDVQATIGFLAHLCDKNVKQVLYLQGLLPLVRNDDAFAALLNLIAFTPRLWALNLGELSFSPNQQAELLESVQNSNIAFMFVDKVSGPTKHKFTQALIKNRMKDDNRLWLFEHGDRQTIMACELMWANPKHHSRNKRHEQQHPHRQQQKTQQKTRTTKGTNGGEGSLQAGEGPAKVTQGINGGEGSLQAGEGPAKVTQGERNTQKRERNTHTHTHTRSLCEVLEHHRSA